MTILAVVGMKREARLVEGPGVRAVVGAGRWDLLEQRLIPALTGARAVISFGIGGALDPTLKVGDVVIAAQVLRPGRRWPAELRWRDRLAAVLPQARLGAIYGTDDMVLDASHKARLHTQTGALMADMESHVGALMAAQRGLPFAAVRVVSDAAAATLPAAVLVGLTEDGAMNLPGVLWAVARDPRQIGPLIEVGRAAEQAFAALAAVSAALGPDLAFSADTIRR